MSTLVERQEALEMLSLRRGIERASRELEELSDRDEIASHPLYAQAIERSLSEVSQLLKGALEDSRGPVVSILKEIDLDLLAGVGLWCSFNRVADDNAASLQSVSRLIGTAVEDEVKRKLLEAADEDEFARIWRKVKGKHSGAKNRRKAMKPLMEKFDIEHEAFSTELKVRIGGFVLNAILRAGVMVLREDGEGVTTVELSPEVFAFVTDLSQEAPWVRPINMPMVVAPKPWRGFADGGYLTRIAQEKAPLVRRCSRRQRLLVEEAIKDGTLAPALQALNIIQGTPWRINQRMFEIVTKCFSEGIHIDDFPRKDTIDVPRYPEDFEELDAKEQRKLKRQREAIRRRNSTIRGQAAMFRTDVTTATEMLKYERFWIPHNFDFRSRVYPIPSFNQQRGDHIRAMLEFADGVELTEEGRDWLMIHAANCGDFDKVSKKSFADRKTWTLNNLYKIFSAADEPFVHIDWWSKADKPFEFLRACIELREWITAETKGVPFFSRLPIQIDGSNSGLQHYSAILRSEDDGKHVNLVPLPAPADVYAEVARRVEKSARLSSDPLARLWLDYGITRKVVKRNVMTFPYSSAAFGFREQIMEDLMTPLGDEVIDGRRSVHPFGDDGGWAASGWMAKEVYKAVTETVSAATSAMSWFKKVAGALAHEGKGLEYVTPVGFPVVHCYTDFLCKRVTMWLFDRTMKVCDAASADVIKDEGVYRRIMSSVRVKPTKTIVKSKQKSAVAPNVIHSMDAAHLMLTTNEAHLQGVMDFSLVHDSFGCHASHMPVLFRVVREQMAAMYENYDPLVEIERRFFGDNTLSEKTRKKVPPRPERGSLDLSRIVASDYAFA